ncbi:MAG: hypothetical protein H7306_19745 [Bacteriovorax sp.]|nr:hypothetical protein [Rhizobacter sp.]
MPPLLRRRTVALPTLWGWAVVLATGLGALGAAVIALAFAANAWLAPNAPVKGPDGRGARILIVEGWLDEPDLDQAVAAFRRGGYERIVTTGAPIETWAEWHPWHSYAERAATYLKAHGLADARIDSVPAPASAQDRTFLSAVIVRDWATRSGVVLSTVDLFSAGVHARRSRLLFQLAFGPGVTVGVLSSAPTDFDARHWWRSSIGTKSVMSETLSLAWTTCCFWPPAPGSHEERWALPTP